MKPIIKWINTNKVRKTLSINGFKEDIICPAHSLENPGFTPYVNKSAYDNAVACIRIIKETGNTEHASDFLKDFDE